MEELSYEELRRIQGRERASPVLQSLPADFYKHVKKLIEKKNDSLKKDFGLAEAKEYESILKVVEDIHDKRKQKIVMKAMRSANVGEGVTLAEEETKLFDMIRSVIAEESECFRNITGCAEGVEEESIKRIKILKPLPKFVGTDMKVYGPFKEGDDIELPDKEAQLLVRKGIAEYTEVVSHEVPK
ncbi:MAG: hypothetical protein Sv326_0927 [Candidatus Fermentimicrarchaeum limneticum]|uniref:Gins51 C-terminal domain-containing protein n=1 Tax=Fermentimicrarchaeum limneticum TaxID=2795018 RepID=A0A7D6BP31_FERL1|nr:MAG: hypothetical protein Sv326_0927 [Candidatus Fermentimicrarchaeum limneticum]